MAFETGIGANQLTFGSLFRIFFWTGLAFWILFGVLMSFLSLAGMDTVSWNGAPVYGIAGFVTGMLISLIAGAIFSALAGVFSALIVKLLGRFLPLGNLRSSQQSFANVSTVFSDDS
ncbi:hypothetical protein V0U79_01025 [Hyphobacterium sp. HN65]|uniref:DUF4282 domain-containing protein n=1 Tax=Hyphobacterium lacteum TaxID=3116575 RepID=A0ABU7LLX0_9PROT|nr:hypothetical protein [Hyphobacterium sp. HN65]MEE2524933.1 hypothetical protein [Hyphobacterium sp. HN65]